MKKVVVTGANGFVGSQLVKTLLDNDYEIYAVVRSATSNVERIPKHKKVHMVYCALNEMKSLPEKIKDEIEFFFHLAWEGTSGEKRSDYELQLKNVKYSCDAVLAATEMKCSRFLYAGSIMEYEAKQYLPLNGAMPGGNYIYSVAKLTADYMAKIVAANCNIEFISYIISNIYGTGEKSKRFINTTIRKMLSKDRLSFTHGEQPYDFIYISDAVRAMILIAEKGIGNTEYYIGNKKIGTLKDYIMRMKMVVSPDVQLYLGEIPFNGTMLDYKEINTGRLEEELEFKMKVSFEKGIQMTKEWMEENDEICM